MLTVTKNDGTVIRLPPPREMSYTLQDLDAEGTGRNQRGYLFRDRVCQKVKLICKWPPMDAQEASELLNAVDEAFFMLSYPDAKTGEYRTMQCYIGDRTLPAISFSDGAWLWQNIAFNFIER